MVYDSSMVAGSLGDGDETHPHPQHPLLTRTAIGAEKHAHHLQHEYVYTVISRYS